MGTHSDEHRRIANSWYDSGTNKQYVAVQIGGAGSFRPGRRGSAVAVFAMSE